VPAGSAAGGHPHHPQLVAPLALSSLAASTSLSSLSSYYNREPAAAALLRDSMREREAPPAGSARSSNGDSRPGSPTAA